MLVFLQSKGPFLFDSELVSISGCNSLQDDFRWLFYSLCKTALMVNV